jgi:hypothetical protein
MSVCRSAPRFALDALVEINDVISTRHVREIGRVIRIQASRRSHTLDKYFVRFASGVEKEFWDIQLTQLDKLKLNQAERTDNVKIAS